MTVKYRRNKNKSGFLMVCFDKREDCFRGVRGHGENEVQNLSFGEKKHSLGNFQLNLIIVLV